MQRMLATSVFICTALAFPADNVSESSKDSCGGSLHRPADPLEHNGVEWPKMCIAKSEAHFFGIGDWGGERPGGRTWVNPGKYKKRIPSGYVPRADDKAQFYVARQMKALAASADPDFVINAGDNFYPGGITRQCGQASTHDVTGQYDWAWRQIYGSLALKPWFSVLGNHDYGGRSFGFGWDSQIMHTWGDSNWRMPAQYWSQTVEYNGFSVKFFMLESNKFDAKEAGKDPDHNICQVRDGSAGSCCGMTVESCEADLHSAWDKSLDMMEEGLKASTAEWHIVVTHFPGSWIASDHRIQHLDRKYGVDLIFTGHDHQQRTGLSWMIPYIVSGGGGGVTADKKPKVSGKDDAYGFVDFTIDKDTLRYDMHSWGGVANHEGRPLIRKSKKIYRHHFRLANTTGDGAIV